MPSGPVPPPAVPPRGPFARLVRWTAWSLALAFVLFCTLLLAVRFVVFPRIESYRDDIAARLSRELAHPVEIDAIDTGWDGWNPRIAVRGLRVRDRAGAALQPLVELAEVSGVVSWTSVLVADLKLRELAIMAPRLSVRRDTAGRVHVAGFEFDPAEHREADSALTDWLLRQRLIVVRDALVTWNDDRRNAPQLLLDNVDFRIESRFGRHRFGLTGTPPPEVAAPIDLRGEIETASLSDWRNGAGRLYLRLDYADVAAWSEWIPLPVAVQSGKGAMRVWFEFDKGIATDVVADVELADVRTRLDDDLPPLHLAHLAGRFSWQHEGAKRSLAVRNLSYAMHDGTTSTPGMLDVRYELGGDGATTGGRIAVARLDLAPLTALATQLPLPASLRDDLARFAARGTLTAAEYAWDGALRAPARFRTQANVDALHLNARDAMPGLANLSGSFEASEAGGALRVASKHLVVTMPRVFAEPLVLDSAAARVRWERQTNAVAVRLDEVEFANAHAAGSAQGTWRSRSGGPGDIDLTAQVRRADARQLHRYLPLAVGTDIRQWLRDSLRAGRSDDARLTLKGDLAKFPFADGKSGTFVVAVKARDATLDYANGWPMLSGVDADVRFEGHGMKIVASRGEILGVPITRATASIADMSLEHPLLAIEGETGGPTTAFLAFIDQSPVGEWIDGATKAVRATGDGRLTLDLALPLGDPHAVAKVRGDYELIDNALTLPGVPALAHVSGHIAFTEREMSGRDLRFEALGGSGRVSLSSREGGMRVVGDGVANLASVKSHVALPYADRYAGATDWHLDLSTGKDAPTWVLTSTLRGVSVDMPAPFAKAAADEVPLRVERKPSARDRARETTSIDYGRTRIVVQQPGAEGVDRALVLFGKAAANRNAEPERAGVTIRGDLRLANVDEWLGWLDAQPGATGTPSAKRVALEAVDVELGELIALGRRFDEVSLSARRATDWRMKFTSRQVEGTATWEPADAKHANGRLSAQLARIELPRVDEIRAQPDPPKTTGARTAGSANPWPQVDISAERFVARAGNLGRMELSARPEGTDWRITRFALVNDAGRIDADGWWRLVGKRQETRLDVAIDVKDSSAFLERMGLPNAVKGAPAKLDGQLEWAGGPTDFEYAALAGTFKVTVGPGQFTKIDPGMGKLLGVLSLQALPRRISLDFRDVFSEGFAFDAVHGSAAIASGVMRTDDLMLSGPAAKVHITGEVNLERETQEISVRVQPSLSTVVSTGAGAAAVALLAANPLVGAAVGAGTLLAQKIMQDPIEQMFSYEYAVRGSWSEPVVERVGSRAFPRLAEPPTATAK